MINIEKEKIDIRKMFIEELINEPNLEESKYKESTDDLINSVCGIVLNELTLEDIDPKFYTEADYLSSNYSKFFLDLVSSGLPINIETYKSVLKLLGEFKSKDDIIQELDERYKRLYADYDNYKKRSSLDRIDTINQNKIKIVSDFLPIMSDLDRAISTLEDKEGVELISNKCLNWLKSHGIEESSPKKDDLFNADTMECIATLEVEDKSGKVIDIITKGWGLNGKIYKFSQVVVGK